MLLHSLLPSSLLSLFPSAQDTLPGQASSKLKHIAHITMNIILHKNEMNTCFPVDALIVRNRLLTPTI